MSTPADTPPADALAADAPLRAEIIATALPYMLRYDARTIVVKYGGHAMGDRELAADFAEDITLLTLAGINAVVVHGGGPQIGQMLERLNIKSEFQDGLRVTTRETVEIVEMVLAGAINKDIVSTINAAGGRAVGLCGKDGRMVLAEPLKRTVRDPDSNIERVLDLGFVGEPVEVRRDVLDVLAKQEIIPVIAPVAQGADGETYNINADTFAGAIAGALGATRLLFLTDVDGVLDSNRELIRELTVAEARRLMASGVISGGMVPKVETCIAALERGVDGVVILNGKTPHAVLLELFTDGGAGTLITR
ncbi:acetylglutamate kinase [Acuticoccus sediminis]|uniref:Acetylglutamate kinase n=1 Tax=Acuticoccus sediminis TaxID=2184697 RepID=A0A8B2P1S1_9HYPH|nr:acetylglutamate kinase [Acuticoccus sediminis]RAI04096.1 acetylglutamate kinase [Acuticoccus sediminis]